MTSDLWIMELEAIPEQVASGDIVCGQDVLSALSRLGLEGLEAQDHLDAIMLDHPGLPFRDEEPEQPCLDDGKRAHWSVGK